MQSGWGARPALTAEDLVYRRVLANAYPARACPLSYRLPVYEEIAREAEAAGDEAGAKALRAEVSDCC